MNMQLKFEKMKPSRSFQHVADQIQAAILDGTLKSGDKLPAEMKLKDMFDTSRGTVREADPVPRAVSGWLRESSSGRCSRVAVRPAPTWTR